MEPTTIEELIEIIKHMNNVGAGADGINAKIFKSTYHSILPHLVHFMNICLEKGVFPEKLKIAVIKPAFKAGKRNTFGNYRPISMLPYISKVLEKIIHTRFIEYLHINHIINEGQFGFQTGLSTFMPHILLQEKITKAFENGHSVCGIYLDLKKAFDTVDPEILLLKLKKYGINQYALKIIDSYLSSRMQCVEIEGVQSDYKDITIGVPQGSILGPLLFLLYINDFPSISKHSLCIQYADDTALFFEGDSAHELQTKLDSDLPNVCKWLKTNKLSLNTNKTFCQLYTMSHDQIAVNVMLDNKNITFVNKIKYLGLWIDDKLSWNEHINHVCTVVSSSIGVLYRTKFFLKQSTLLLLYNSLVLPHFSYCSIIWAHTFPTYVHKVELLQKKAIRLVDNADRLAHSEPIFKKLKLLKVKDIAKQQIILLTQKTVKRTLHNAIDALFHLAEPRNRQTRRVEHLIEPFTYKLYRTQTLSWLGPRLWNDIIVPKFPNIQEVPKSKYIMKKITKDHFLNVSTE